MDYSKKFYEDVLGTYFSTDSKSKKKKSNTIDDKRKKAFDFYKECKNNSKLIKVYITYAKNTGELICNLNEGIQGFIPANEVEKGYNFRKRSKYVGKEFYVLVVDIDENNNKVLLSKLKAEPIVEKVIKDYVRSYKPGMKVSANILFYSTKNKRIYIDLGAGFLGYIPAKQWANRFVDIEYEVNKLKESNDTNIEVVIMEYKPKKDKYQEIFICSRKDALPDPWEGIEEDYKRNDIIEAECIDMHRNKFFCRLPDENRDLDIYCEYPDPERDNMNNIIKEAPQIKIGSKYKLRIYRVSEKDKLLKARVIDVVD